MSRRQAGELNRRETKGSYGPCVTRGRAPREDVGGAHGGLAATVVASVVVSGVWSPGWALLVSGCVAVWFVLALVVVHLRGGRGRVAVRRAYVATFGWADHLTP